MRDWISDLLIFSAGITGGILIAHLKPYLQSTGRKRIEIAQRACWPTSKSDTTKRF